MKDFDERKNNEHISVVENPKHELHVKDQSSVKMSYNTEFSIGCNTRPCSDYDLGKQILICAVEE